MSRWFHTFCLQNPNLTFTNHFRWRFLQVFQSCESRGVGVQVFRGLVPGISRTVTTGIYCFKVRNIWHFPGGGGGINDFWYFTCQTGRNRSISKSVFLKAGKIFKSKILRTYGPGFWLIYIYFFFGKENRGGREGGCWPLWISSPLIKKK